MNQDAENPYATPISDPLPLPVTDWAGHELTLATLSERFAGAFFDGLINFALVIPLWALLYFSGSAGSFASLDQLGIGYDLLLGVVGFGLFVLVQWRSLKASGQTIGKKWAKTRIVTMAGEKPAINDLIWKRYLFLNLIGLIPVIGSAINLLNILFIFRKSRRCLHDVVAGTQVVKAVPAQSV